MSEAIENEWPNDGAIDGQEVSVIHTTQPHAHSNLIHLATPSAQSQGDISQASVLATDLTTWQAQATEL